MNEKAAVYAALFAGIATGNVLYQWVTSRDYKVALERAYFQGMALLMAFILT